MTPTPAAQRIEWLDAARGLAIVVVVFGHVLRGLEAAGEAEIGIVEAARDGDAAVAPVDCGVRPALVLVGHGSYPFAG